jgi:hypothetical protein
MTTSNCGFRVRKLSSMVFSRETYSIDTGLDRNLRVFEMAPHVRKDLGLDTVSDVVITITELVLSTLSPSLHIASCSTY